MIKITKIKTKNITNKTKSRRRVSNLRKILHYIKKNQKNKKVWQKPKISIQTRILSPPQAPYNSNQMLMEFHKDTNYLVPDLNIDHFGSFLKM